MAILRKAKKDHFTVIDNTVFYDYDLSFKAKGLLCQMLSLPDGWQFSIEGLTKLSNDGKSAVTSALNELQEKGYFYRKQLKNEGKFTGVEYIVSETPLSEKPMTENPMTEKPISENPPQLNTNTLSTKPLKTKEIYTEFEKLWELYPKKQGKDKAYKSYEKARKSGTTYDDVYRGILAYREFLEAMETDMQFVKMGSTFFSQKAWEDDYHYYKKKSTDPFTEMLLKGDY